jgi:hypothetical protein
VSHRHSIVHTRGWWDRWASCGRFTSGIVDDGPAFRGRRLGQYGLRVLGLVCSLLCVGFPGGVGVEPRGCRLLGWLFGTLLGPEESGALPVDAPSAGLFGGWCGVGVGWSQVVWFLDSGREHLCSKCNLSSIVFVCVIVCCLCDLWHP